MTFDLLEPTRFWSVDPAEPVKIRMGAEGMAAETPLTIPEGFNFIVERFPNHPAMCYEVDKEWKTVTYSEYHDKVHHVAKAFIKLGLEPRHSVGILSFNCPEWFYSDMAAIFADGLAAGIYTTNSADAVCHILKNSRANIVVVEDEKQLQKVRSIRDQLPHLKAIILLSGSLNSDLKQEDGYYTWKDVEMLDVVNVEEEYNGRIRMITPNQSALLIFTSGTVGMPKGVLISHDSITWNCKQVETRFGSPKKAREVFVSYLPLSHVAGQFMDVFLAMYVGATVYFADKNALKGTLAKTLRIARPTRFMGVPRVYEKFQEALIQQTSSVSVLKRSLLGWGKQQSFSHHMGTIRGKPTTSLQYLLAKKTILRMVKTGLGLDRCTSMLVGAAPTALEVKEFFLGLDLPLLELFGMSETAGPLTLVSPEGLQLNSVGKCLPGTYVKILNPDKDGIGEMVNKGRHVFMGYIGDEEKTSEALDEDGWLHTGDLGCVDDNGYLRITGRIKELIITAGGENIPPTHVEELVKNQLACVSNAFLVGDHRKFLTMLITLKTEMDTNTGAPMDELNVETKAWLKELGLQYTKLTEVIAAGPCPTVLKAIEVGIVRANKNAISNAQMVQKFKLLSHDFSIPTGELGPTLKVKRSVVNQMYKDEIESLYA